MFKFLVLFALALVEPCFSGPEILGPLPGPCPKLPSTVRSTSLKGKEAYTWGQNVFFPLDKSRMVTECALQTLEPSITEPSFGAKILGTDNKNFVVSYICEKQVNGHLRAAAVFTTSKNPSPAVVAAIKKSFTDNKLDVKHLAVTC